MTLKTTRLELQLANLLVDNTSCCGSEAEKVIPMIFSLLNYKPRIMPEIGKESCVNCKFFSEYDASDKNEHTYHIEFCNKHNYGMSMWNCNEVACTKFESKLV